MEKRQVKFRLNNIEEDKDIARISGYGSVFGNVDSYDSSILHGAFARTINANPKVPILNQHNTDEPIGATVSLKEDNYGLFFEAEISLLVQKGRELVHLLKMGALKGVSIGFNIVKDQYDSETKILKILEVKLWELSLVTFPANPLAMVTDLKSIAKDHLRMAATKSAEINQRMNSLHSLIVRSCKAEKEDFSQSVQLLNLLEDELKALREALVKQAHEPAANADPEQILSALRELTSTFKSYGG